MSNLMYSRRQFIGGSVGALAAVALAGCSGGSSSSGSSSSSSSSGSMPTVRLALEASSHVLNVIAEEQGYLADEGIKVEYVPCSTYEDAFTGLAGNKIDVLSNYGTNLPCQYISKQTDITIFGGYMITGCMPFIAKAGTEWHGITDILGKKVAGLVANYQVTGPLLDMGYDPQTEVTWLNYADMTDRIAAVKNGEADYAVLSTGYTYQVQNDSALSLVAFCSDILPDYSCCRVECNTSWLNSNKDTVKSLLKAWLRAQNWYENNKEETAKLVAKQIGASEEYAAAYVTNDHFKLNVDPYRSSIRRAWNYLGKLGALQEGYEKIDLDAHINTEIYKQALDECTQKYYNEAPKFYDAQKKIYEENDL